MLNIKGIKKVYKNNKNIILITATVLVVLLVINLVLFLLYSQILSGKIYPNISVSGVEVSGLSTKEAQEKINDYLSPAQEIEIYLENETVVFPITNINIKYDVEKSIQTAYLLGRSSNLKNNITFLFNSIQNSTNLPLEYSLSKDLLSKNVQVFSEQASLDPVYPTIKKVGDDFLTTSGKSGLKIDEDGLMNVILQRISYNDYSPISLMLEAVDPTWTDSEITDVKLRALKLYDRRIVVSHEEYEKIITNDELIGLLDKNNTYSAYRINELSENIAQEINRPFQNPVFEFENNRVQEFKPAQEGREVNITKLKMGLLKSLASAESTEESVNLSLAVNTTSPDYSTDDVNNLGIRELLGKGDSRFAGSIASRVHNVGLASSKFHGILVPPGETVSFNEYLGDVSTYTGYQQAYVIKNGRTVLGDGGGVCQVSTTLFRAVLDAGLPIVERSAHSYRVSYYEQGSPPGLDATVYAPSPDLKFANDTPGHILIQTEFSAANTTLVFEIYGTDDGREATVSTPIVLSTVAPPEDLYVDDPTLPAGQIKQIDWKAAGARVYFDYTVTRDGKEIYYKEFYSNYRPWQSVFLRGTGPV